jgi:A/G-specific adenine glycosylase
MLQQTQVATVIPYYMRFVASFPDIAALATATEEQVLAHWSGLGYYARGRNLHKAARMVVERHGGVFPRDFELMQALPGIGRSTAAAISALAWNERRAILDGNVKRVLARHRGVEGWTGQRQTEQQLWALAESLLPESEVAIYTQALMDMGATLCTRARPRCSACPVREDCVAWNSDRVESLPAPRPRKAVPEREATFLLLTQADGILLERRPPQGVWGGLWCMPQVVAGAEEAYLSRHGLRVMRRAELGAFSHTFTHFRLHIRPVLLELQDRPLRAEQPGAAWMKREEALRAALPSPVRRLLLELQQQSGG